jgi:hypothetical protein
LISNKDQRLACNAREGIPVVYCAATSYPKDTALCQQSSVRDIPVPKATRTSSPQKFNANDVASMLDAMPDAPATKDVGSEWIEIINTALVILFVILLYFFPTSIAFKRGHHNKRAIFALNILLGWTFLGWVVALVWAWTTPNT